MHVFAQYIAPYSILIYNCAHATRGVSRAPQHDKTRRALYNYKMRVLANMCKMHVPKNCKAPAVRGFHKIESIYQLVWCIATRCPKSTRASSARCTILLCGKPHHGKTRLPVWFYIKSVSCATQRMTCFADVI